MFIEDQTTEDIEQTKKRQSFRDDLGDTDIILSPTNNKEKIQEDHHDPVDAEISIDVTPTLNESLTANEVVPEQLSEQVPTESAPLRRSSRER